MTKRQKATKVLLEKLELIDKYVEVDNMERYKNLFKSLSDKEFDEYMKMLRDGDTCIYIYVPNLKKHPNMENLISVAKKLGVKLVQYISIYDDVSKSYFETGERHFIGKVPIRRMQQYGKHKIGIPKSDKHIDGMSGQVYGDSRAAGITNPETQSLVSKGLMTTTKELVSIRGGNIEAYRSGIQKQGEENGVIYLSEIGTDSKNRTAVVTQVLMEALMLENNIMGD